MPRANFTQTSFLGGEISNRAQGRWDLATYATSLAFCLNAVMSEEGSWVRRGGTQRIAPTRSRNPASILPMISSTGCAFCCEFTLDNLQFYDGTAPVFTNDQRTVSTSSFSGGALTLGLDAAHGWSVGDCVMLAFPAGYAVANEAACRGRIMQLIGGSTGSTLVLEDDTANALPTLTGFVANTSLVGATVYHILRFTTTYTTAQLPNLRLVQAQQNGIVLVAGVAPQVLTVTEPVGSTDPTFTWGALTLVDGPYLDPQPQTLTLSGTSGTITLTAGSSVFLSTDVGRHVRIFTQPAAWSASTNYVAGNQVTDVNGAWWTAIIPSGPGSTTGTAVTPGQVVSVSGVQQLAWTAAPNAGTWAWGKIATYSSGTSVTFTFDTSIPNMALIAANGTTAAVWQLGVYSTLFPTCGTYYEGRLYLGGALPNRFDTTTSNGAVGTTATFSPTDPWGNVLDNSGISATLNAQQTNNINWMIPDQQGVIMGTFEGEWLIAASQLSDPITPTSIQAHMVTKYGSEAIDPRRIGMAVAFPQRYGARIEEFLADAFTSKFNGRPLNEYARELFGSGVARMAYQDEPIPILWTLMNNGQLNGCTYRRISRFANENPVFNAWHHQIYNAGALTDIAIIPVEKGPSDLVYVVAHDAFGYFVEVLRPALTL